MQKLAPLEFGHYYHIYNRGIHRENIFFEARNCSYFLDLGQAYRTSCRHVCLLSIEKSFPFVNSYQDRRRATPDLHSRARNLEGLIKQAPMLKVAETFQVLNLTQQFSNLFNADAKAINQAYNRTGGLFQERFGRVPVESEKYFVNLVAYIHRNPQKHGFVDDYREYPYSSFAAFCSVKPTKVKR